MVVFRLMFLLNIPQGTLRNDTPVEGCCAVKKLLPKDEMGSK